MTNWQGSAKAAVKKAVPNQGFQDLAIRRALAIVCHDMTIVEAIHAHLPPGRLDRNKGIALDRFREGQHALARHWRMV